MKILVTGANGMFGQDLCPILEDNGYDVIETDVYNLDITDVRACEQFLSQERPNIVIHSAAYTNVEKAEEDLITATRINVKGAENIAKICQKIGAVMVYISTDYVFDGKKTEPYLPIDEPNPINNYGLTKFQGENLVKKYCDKYYIIRTSWLYGHYGKNFVETMIKLAKKGDEVKVVSDQIGCPTWTVELANNIVEIFEKEDYGIYHVCGSGETSWYGFAKEIFAQLNININLKSCLTEEFKCQAQRPKYSVLENYGVCRNWKLALKDYLALRLEEEF